MGEAAARLTRSYEAGGLSADAYRRLVAVLDLFDEYGEPAVAEGGTLVHMTWAAGRASVTASVGSVGYWGVAVSRGAGEMACSVGAFDDAGERAAFGRLLMLGKATLAGELIVAAEKRANAGRRKPKTGGDTC